MYFSDVVGRTNCEKTQLKSWLKDGVIVPLKSGSGPGTRAVFDDSNLVCTSIAVMLNEMHITVARYASAFIQLHKELRSTSSLGWSSQVIMMSPDSVCLQKIQFLKTYEAKCAAVIIKLDEIMNKLQIEEKNCHQLSFGIGYASVG